MSHTIEELMKESFNKNASDLHLTAGAYPTMRINGKLVSVGDEKLSNDTLEGYLKFLANDKHYSEFLEKGEVDFSYGIKGVSRFRINGYRQRDSVALAIRLIPAEVPTFDSLCMPSVVKTLVEKNQGLILVTGPTGSGKSTTLAAMIDLINKTKSKHIITLEDPIEYLHKHNMSLIEQREIGLDSLSFANGLRSSLRQDPDVILIGEMRDLETISTAITAAETGHLVLATLHTIDSASTINRIIDAFPAYQQPQIRTQLASVLVGVLSQRLLPTTNQDGRALVMEILINTPAVANLIRTEKVHQIKNSMQTGREYGMQTMNNSTNQMINNGKINREIAKQYIPNFSDI